MKRPTVISYSSPQGPWKKLISSEVKRAQSWKKIREKETSPNFKPLSHSFFLSFFLLTHQARPFRWSLFSREVSVRPSVRYKKKSLYSTKTKHDTTKNKLQPYMGPGGSLNSPDLSFWKVRKPNFEVIFVLKFCGCINLGFHYFFSGPKAKTKSRLKKVIPFVMLIHSADPQSWPEVIIIFDVVSVRPSVPTFQNITKHNKHRVKIMIATDVGLWVWTRGSLLPFVMFFFPFPIFFFLQTSKSPKPCCHWG